MAGMMLQTKTTARIAILFIVGILLSASVAIPACARPPPPEYWAGYMLPQPDAINGSIRSEFTITNEAVPKFPDLSPYYACQDILYKKTGDHYVSEVWYFTNTTDMGEKAASVRAYLSSHGNISDTTLDLLPELEQYSAQPWTAQYYHDQLNYPVQNIPVIEYRSNETSGYLVIMPNHRYIAYYGRAGSYRPDDNASSIQKVLIMTVVPSHLAGEFGHTIPPSDHDNPLSPLLSPFRGMIILLVVVFGLLVSGIIMFFMKRSKH